MVHKLANIAPVIFSFIIATFISTNLLAQDLYSALQDFNNGRFDAVRNTLSALESIHYNQPEYILLNALLEGDGEQAFTLYSSMDNLLLDNPLVEKALWRMCQYYYAKGLYQTFEENVDRFLTLFPDSELRETAYHMQERVAKSSTMMTQAIPAEEENQEPQFTLQFGAFGNETGARTRLEYLRNLGLTSSTIYQQNVGNRILYKIWVGEFVSRGEADKMRDEYRGRFRIPDIFVVTLESQ